LRKAGVFEENKIEEKEKEQERPRGMTQYCINERILRGIESESVCYSLFFFHQSAESQPFNDKDHHKSKSIYVMLLR
jgi:hypothetical protein